MGDRISIQFEKDGDLSVCLFSHWGGMGFLDQAKEYAGILKNERTGQMMPLDRMEPDTVMVDFIRHITRGMKRVENTYYLGATPDDGDNSDNGHHIINLGEV